MYSSQLLTLWSRFSAHYPASLGKVERRWNGTLSRYTPGQKWKCLWHEIHLRLFSAHFPCLESLVWEMSCGVIFKLHTCWSVSLRRSRQLVLVGFYFISAFLAGLSTTQTVGSECLSSIKFSFNQTKTLSASALMGLSPILMSRKKIYELIFKPEWG